MSSVASLTRATLAKDLRLEWRSKDAINSMLFFSLLVVVIFSFSFDPTAEESRRIAGGLVWVAFLFAAVVALNQTWSREILRVPAPFEQAEPLSARPGDVAGGVRFRFGKQCCSADHAGERECGGGQEWGGRGRCGRGRRP